MTPIVGFREAGSAVPMSKLGIRVTLPVMILLLSQIGLYVWMAPRGFDFTDESYYFLNYLYWRDLVGTVTFFGAYFEWPYRMLGQSVPAIRIFSLLLLLFSSAFFMREVLGYVSRRDGSMKETPWVFVAVGMAASLFYFGPLSTLRAPSYNLLALCSMLVATGLLLRGLERSDQFANARLTMLFYGITIGVCGLGKASSGMMLALLHALFFVLVNRDWQLRRLLELLAFSLAGVSLNFIALQWAHPQWLVALREGMTFASMDGSHNMLDLVNTLRWEIQAVAPIFLACALGAGLTVALLARWIIPFRRTTLSAFAVMLISSCVLGLIWSQTRWWLPLIVMAALLLWSVDGLSCKPFRLMRGDLTDFALIALLFALPVAFSFGTNVHLLEHSQMAAVFPVTALLIQLTRLARLGILAPPALVVCLAALCLPTLVIQVRAATDVHYTYRQLRALGEQALPVRIGATNNTLLVDTATRKTLQSVIDAARAVGLSPGQAILDFTGDSPGLVYALGGRPLGLAWLLGGYPGSQDISAKMIEKLPIQALRNAWLLSSDNNPRAINGWQQLLNARLDPGTHELVATVLIRTPYHWRKEMPDRLSVHIWKPRFSPLP